MKKSVISILVLLLVLLTGIWIGKAKFQSNSDLNTSNFKEIDTAQANFEKKIEDKYPTYTVQGGLPLPEDKYRQIVDYWYGFRFRIKGSSCTNPDNQIIDVKHNNRTDSILKVRICKDWYHKFEKTVDSLYRIDTLAVYIAKNDISVKKLLKIKSENIKEFFPHYSCYPTTQKNLKVVSITWRDTIYNEAANVSFMRVAVDIKEKKVRKIEDTEMEWNEYR